MTIATTFAGQFLIAMPSLVEPPFARGVAFLCQHGEDGAVGLLINQLSDYRLGDVLAQMKLRNATTPELADHPVLIGGPVQQERGFVLHREPGNWDSSYRVNDDWSVTTSRDILVAMAAGEGPRRARRHARLRRLARRAAGAGSDGERVADHARGRTRRLRYPHRRTLGRRRAQARRARPSQLAGYAGHA